MHLTEFSRLKEVSFSVPCFYFFCFSHGDFVVVCTENVVVVLLVSKTTNTSSPDLIGSSTDSNVSRIVGLWWCWRWVGWQFNWVYFSFGHHNGFQGPTTRAVFSSAWLHRWPHRRMSWTMSFHCLTMVAAVVPLLYCNSVSCPDSVVEHDDDHRWVRLDVGDAYKMVRMMESVDWLLPFQWLWLKSYEASVCVTDFVVM